MEILFWIGLVGSAYSYFVYPLFLWCLPKKARESSSLAQYPSISLIITAHNEQHRIRAKLENSLALDYPADRLDVVVASDNSTDATDAIVSEYSSRGIRLVRAEERKGKEYAQLQAIRCARGDILVFSDVATQIPPNALLAMVVNFQDTKVGAVSSEDRFLDASGKAVGEGAYIRYEMWLRALESAVGGIVGLSGSFFAARKSICEYWDISVPSDFNTALNCALLNYVAISDPNMLGYYSGVHDDRKEYQRKLRTIIRGMTAVLHKPIVLNPAKLGFFAFKVWSHKLLRWAVPWFLVLLFVASAVLATRHWFYYGAFVVQLAFYLLAALGAASPRLRRQILVKLPYFFIQANMAAAHAALLFLMGRRVTVWSPTKR